MSVLKQNELVDIPWKNGGGVTRRIAKGLSGDHVAWTISRADVGQNGPFSDFAGMRRILTVVSGGTMLLHSSTHSLEALMWQPVNFDGGLSIHSELRDGPLTDLNLMFDPTICDGTVIARCEPFKGQIERPTHGLLAAHVLSGTPKFNGHHLNVGDTFFAETDDVSVHLGDGDAILEIRLDYGNHKDAIRLCIAPL